MKYLKSLSQLFKEVLSEKAELHYGSAYIIVEIDNNEFDSLDLLYEGNWRPSDEKDFWYRVDAPKFDHEKRHIHIAHKKHINSKSKQVSPPAGASVPLVQMK